MINKKESSSGVKSGKYYLILSLSAIFAMLAFVQVFAADNNVDVLLNAKDKAEQIKAQQEARQEIIAQKEEQKQERQQDRLHSRAEDAIQKRIQALERVLTQLSARERITQSVRQDVEGEVHDEIDSLKSLSEQIKSEEDADKLKEQIRSVFYEYRIFAVFIPQMRGFETVGKGEYIANKIEKEIIPRIEAALDEADENGKDTSGAREQLALIEVELVKMNENLGEAYEYFSQMEPAEDYAPAREKIQEGKKTMLEVRENIRVMREELKKIRQLLSEISK